MTAIPLRRGEYAISHIQVILLEIEIADDTALLGVEPVDVR
jgi:hypothetical protein